MGHKRMKKRNKRCLFSKSRIGNWLKKHVEMTRRDREKAFIDVVLSGNPTHKYSFDSNTGVVTFPQSDFLVEVEKAGSNRKETE